MFDDEAKKIFEVGDVIVVKNWATTFKLTVTRVTKLHAICDVKREDGTGYTQKFKRDYSVFHNNKAFVRRVPRIEWDQNEYTVIPKSED